jgi:hypothetical protein
MSIPFIYISTWKIKEGKLEEYKRFYKKLVEIIETHEPQMISFSAFVNEEGTEMTSIQVHPDAESMNFHLQVLGQQVGDAMKEVAGFLKPISAEYYGAVPKSMLEFDWGDGVAVDIKPQQIAGFTRLTAA